MFTGIVEEVGVVEKIERNDKSFKIDIKARIVTNNTNLGDSISVDGVCLTVTDIKSDKFSADIMAETIRKSSLNNIEVGRKVNLERAMCLNGRFGGHIVSGHIDGIGQIQSFINEDNAVWVSIKATEDILKYIVYKGSIAIDGISLTVAYIDDKCFKVSIIPHTKQVTTLLNKKVGDFVNLECDMIGKYIYKFMNDDNKEVKSNINENFLRNNGFM